jgi:NAD(P)-dependent dehydrogenase (short-subunit alcohol dehydrogenase family)
MGIGRATAERFLNEGAAVIIVDKDRKAGERTLQELAGMNSMIEADVTKEDDVKQAFLSVDKIWGGLDVLINNAGISIRQPFLEITPESWRSVMDVNLQGVFYTARHAAERMKKSGGGVILNMGSTNGLTGYPFYAAYNASKAGVIELTRSMALELGPDIRVNAVCPGFILTPMQETEYTPEMMRTFEEKIPLKRLGKPEEVAALFAFLASNEARYITGQHFVIDGGETAGGLASR